MDDAERKALEQTRSLASDTNVMMRVFTDRLRSTRIKSPTQDQENYFTITAHLWGKLAGHCRAVGILLEAGAFESAIVVNRAAYEAATQLIYLIRIGDKLHNAALYRARSLLEIADTLADRKSGEQAHKVLSGVTPAIAEAAKRFKRARTSWSGKSLSQMADAIGVVGHEPLYAVQSWAAHGRIAGYDARGLDKGADYVLRYDAGAKPSETEALANSTRRIRA